jgi:solute carrier family 25 phosphate transporter 3
MRYSHSCNTPQSRNTDEKGMATPIDVVKTRIQVDPSLKGKGMFTAGRSIVAAEGTSALLTGFGPTAVGYFVQGGLKFVGYEFWKTKIINATGDYNTAVEHRTAIYLSSAAIAEFFADIALCPLEATRIRLVSERGFASGLTTGFIRILREDGVLRGFYSGFIPILCKQVRISSIMILT